jgi:LysR family transcriptional regulator for metE and metH
MDLEARSAFRVEGVAASQSHGIDIPVTPGPVAVPDLRCHPVVAHELRLNLRPDLPLAGRAFVAPIGVLDGELLTVPIPIGHLAILSRFLIPADGRPKRQVPGESLELMLQLVGAAQGVSVLPAAPGPGGRDVEPQDASRRPEPGSHGPAAHRRG